MGWVYVLKNPYMKGIYKVGMTTRRRLDSRVNEIWMSTGVPAPFEVVYAKRTRNPAKLERDVHIKLQRWRVHEKREFFKCSVFRIRSAINREAGIDPITFRWSALVVLALLLGIGSGGGFESSIDELRELTLDLLP
jgi:hypothetical protein